MGLHMRITADLLVSNLSTGLYKSIGQRLAELIRNALRACMPDPTKWEPKLAKIEIFLTSNHPLANHQLALTCLYHGCGLTDPNFERFFAYLGTPLSKLRSDNYGHHIGDSQKGIGRLAALASNEMCHHKDRTIRVKNGFYLLTRTSETGKVRFVPYIPENVELDGIDTDRWIEPTATEMGPLKGIAGSFTAIVIPTPIFKTHAEIYEAVKWFLPREEDKMFELLIGPYGSAKAVRPPPLQNEKNCSSIDGQYRARLGVGGKKSDGIWLCDSETGLRVASCIKLGDLLPEPLWFPDLVGDIFAPRFLCHQDTSRDTLTIEFTRKTNKEWLKFLMFLNSQVVPLANKMVERDLISGDAAETLNELAVMFHDRFGPPEEKKITVTPVPPNPDPEPPKPPNPNPGGGGGGGEGYKRYISIKVRDETFLLYRGQSLHPYIFAQVNPANRKMIQVNVRGGYKALPDTQYARKEHCLMEVLYAIGTSKFQGEPDKANHFAHEIRSEFLKK